MRLPPAPDRERGQTGLSVAFDLPTQMGRVITSYSIHYTKLYEMQRTNAAKPAYDAYDEGRKALSEKKLDEALSLANKALDP